MQIAVLGIDLGKTSSSLVGLDMSGMVLVRRRMRREAVLSFAAGLSSCTVAMEACCGAHHVGRALEAQGHTVRLMSPVYVRPYVKAQKNDDRDAEAIAEAATRPTMRFVTLKSEAQLDLQTLHRVRDQLVRDRTSLMNQVRSLLLERGHVVPQGRSRLAIRLQALLEDDAGAFACGHDLAAWLGLVPRQVTTGGRPRLFGITKRGSKYLRKMLIQGARAAMQMLQKSPGRIGEWL